MVDPILSSLSYQWEYYSIFPKGENLGHVNIIGVFLMNSNLRMIVAGGGTGGHFFPAQAICESLRSRGVKVIYVGSRYGIESNYFNYKNSEATLLNIRGIQRHFSLDALMKNCLFPWRFIQSYFQSRKIITKFKPHVVIGTGGYSSGLPLLAAIHKGIKTVIQEQNSFPGMTTRQLGPKVNKVCIAFEDAKHYLKKKTLLLQGILFGTIFG